MLGSKGSKLKPADPNQGAKTVLGESVADHLRRRLNTKAELLQLICTQFPSLGIFVSKKLRPLFLYVSVLKVVY